MGRILVISPRDSDLVRECHVAGPIDDADHLTVLTSIKAREPKLLIKMVCFRPWKSVDPEKFAIDLSRSSFVPNPSNDPPRLECSSNGRALALHARGTEIDAPRFQDVGLCPL